MVDRSDQRPAATPSSELARLGTAQRRALTLLGVALGVLLVGGCAGPWLLCRLQPGRAPSHYTWQQLDGLPEAQLYPPECAPSGRRGEDATRDAWAYHPTTLAFGCETTLDDRALQAWYERELTARGWESSPIDWGSGGYSARWFGWRKGELHFRVIVWWDSSDGQRQESGAVHRYTMEIQADEPTR